MNKTAARKQTDGQMDNLKTQCSLPTVVARNTKYAKQLLVGPTALCKHFFQWAASENGEHTLTKWERDRIVRKHHCWPDAGTWLWTRQTTNDTHTIHSFFDLERDIALWLRNFVSVVEQRVHAEPRQRATHLKHVVLHTVTIVTHQLMVMVKKVKKGNLYSALYISSLSLKRSDMARVWQGDHTVLPATHTLTIPAFTPQPQGITALWLVLIVPTHERMARLSWPEWLVTCRDKCPSPGNEPGYGHPPQY